MIETPLKIIKFSDNNKIITFICPICYKTWEDEYIKSDPKNSLYVIAMCDGCNSDNKPYGAIFYDKYGIALKIEEKEEE